MGEFGNVSVVAAITSVASVFIAYFLYRHNRQQRLDQWISKFSEIHSAFWNDNDMADVRYWTATDSGYQVLGNCLKKRRDIDNNHAPIILERDDYIILEKLDKFINLTHRAHLYSAYSNEKELWRLLFGKDWESIILNERRADLEWYVQRFHPEVMAYIRNYSR